MTRRDLPQRRRSESFSFDHYTPSGGAFRYVATVGLYEDGSIGEVFMNSSKLTTEQDIAARDTAILISFALQHGVPIDAISNALTRGEDGSPHGVAASLFDAIRQRVTA